MEVTGYMLKEVLKLKSIELQAVQSLFDESLYKFEDENKMDPSEVVSNIQKLEEEISILQTAQSYYNLQVKVNIVDKKITLEQSIKLVGGAGRISKMWRNAAAGNTRDKWGRGRIETRKVDEERAISTLTNVEALNYAKEAEKIASALRSAIAVGNTEKVNIDWIDAGLFS